ncbi:MAG TPA: hypothetical protein DCL48_10780, partial [Alphaproteobacteria bacterium]|nr:hypothetical protein [Alphaproteobacteria bacterium]
MVTARVLFSLLFKQRRRMRSWSLALVLVPLLAGLSPVFAQPAEPDLVVAEVLAFGDGDLAAVTAIIRNQGRGASPRAVVTLYDRTARQTENALVRDLAPGAQTRAVFQTRVAKTASIQVMVDSDRRIPETDETNNRTLNTSVASLLRGGQRPAERTAGERTPGAQQGTTLRVEPAIGAGLPRLSLGRRADGSARAAAAIRSASGTQSPFVEDELILVGSDPAVVAAFAAKFGGRIDGQLTKGAAGLPRLYRIIVNVDAPVPFDFGAAAQGFSVSSARAAHLLAIAGQARQAGLKPSLNFVLQSTDMMMGKTNEDDGMDAAQWSYIREGGPYFVNAIGAWRVLQAAKRTRKQGVTVPLMILDKGYADGDGDLPPHNNDNPGGANTYEKSKPWHGTQVAEAAAAQFDDGRGGVGSAPQVAALDLRTAPSDLFAVVESLGNLVVGGYGKPFILNISGAAAISTEGIGGWFSESGIGVLDDVAKAVTDSGVMVFASAGNEGKNVDWRTENGKGPEGVVWVPCENTGVICVGGFESAKPEAQGGKADIANGSNRGSDTGDTVDIYGPFTLYMGDNPQDGTSLQIKSGTSFSSPFVAGVAAMVKAANPNLSAGQVWGLMAKHAKVFEGFRVVNAYGPVREAIMMNGVNIPPMILSLSSPGSVASEYGAITANAVVFDVEDEAKPKKHAWFVDDKLILTNNGNLQNFPAKGLAIGKRILRVDVIDSAGAIASRTTTFEVTNAKPKVIFTSPVTVTSDQMPGQFGAKDGVFHEFVIEVQDGLAVANAALCKDVVWTIKPQNQFPKVIPNPGTCSLVTKFPGVGVFDLVAS